MKKRAVLLLLVLVLTMQICAVAVEPRSVAITPTLTFSGSTATCQATVYETTANSYLVVTMKLWADNQCLKTWTKTGVDRVLITETAPATKGETYTLTVDVMVNGITKPRYSITKTY